MDLSGLGATRLAVWTAAEAQRAGLSRDAVRRRVTSGTWQRLHGRVLADAGYELDPRQRAAAAVAAIGEDAVAVGRLAARWWGLPLIDDPQHADAQLEDVSCERRVARRGNLVPHRWKLRTDDVVDVDGVRLTTPLRTLADLSVLVRLDALLCACDAMVAARHVSSADIAAAAIARRGRPGAPALAWCAAWVDGRAQSPLETLTRIVLWSPELPAFEPQLLVRDDDGRVLAALDHGLAAVRLGIESDGAGPHSLPDARFTDRHRESMLAEHRYVLQRVTWPDVRGRRADVRRRAAAGVASQARRLGIDASTLPRSALPAPPPHIWT